MKQGKWNYTEDIAYTAVLVKLLAVPETPMHWQNAFAGQPRQAVWIEHCGDPFLIDNEDGSGLLKIAKGGGPDSYSAHIGPYELVMMDVPESEWIQFDLNIHNKQRNICDEWQKANFPEEFERMQGLRRMIESRNFHVDRNGTIQPGKK